MSEDIVSRDTCVSRLNWLEDVREGMNFHPDITIADCTLRDGEQQAGIVFTKEDKVEIALQLDRLGVHEIEVGTPAVSREDLEAAEAIAGSRLRAKITALARAKTGDIDCLEDIGVWGALISLPIGEMQLKYKLKLSDQEYLSTARKIAGYAREKGLYVIFSPYDTTRSNLTFLKTVIDSLVRDGTVDRVRLVDTVGAAGPEAIRYLTRFMIERLQGIPLEIHCHNDFGLAVASTIASLSAGARVASTTINGIGERCGNTPTEELVMGLKALYGIDLGIRTEEFYRTSKLVEQLSGVRLQAHKPVVGETAFAHESGMVVAGVLNMPFAAEPYRPELVGRKRSIVIGKKSGLASIREKVRGYNLDLNEKQLAEVMEKVKSKALSVKRGLNDAEFEEILYGAVE